MSAIFGSGNPNEKRGSKNHSAQRARPINKPSGMPTTIAAARPASARHSVPQSGAQMRPSANTCTHRTAISLTGGNTFGLTTPARATSSQAPSTTRIGINLVSKGMPRHQPAQSGKVEPIEQEAEHRKIDHDRQHGIVGAGPTIGEDQIAESGLRRDELGGDEHDDRNRNRGAHA